MLQNSLNNCALCPEYRYLLKRKHFFISYLCLSGSYDHSIWFKIKKLYTVELVAANPPPPWRPLGALEGGKGRSTLPFLILVWGNFFQLPDLSWLVWGTLLKIVMNLPTALHCKRELCPFSGYRDPSLHTDRHRSCYIRLSNFKFSKIVLNNYANVNLLMKKSTHSTGLFNFKFIAFKILHSKVRQLILWQIFVTKMQKYV